MGCRPAEESRICILLCHRMWLGTSGVGGRFSVRTGCSGQHPVAQLIRGHPPDFDAWSQLSSRALKSQGRLQWHATTPCPMPIPILRTDRQHVSVFSKHKTGSSVVALLACALVVLVGLKLVAESAPANARARSQLRRWVRGIESVASRSTNWMDFQSELQRSNGLSSLLHGKELDLWGSPIQVDLHEESGGGVRVRLSSYGPDRKPDTADDVEVSEVILIGHAAGSPESMAKKT